MGYILIDALIWTKFWTDARLTLPISQSHRLFNLHMPRLRHLRPMQQENGCGFGSVLQPQSSPESIGGSQRMLEASNQRYVNDVVIQAAIVVHSKVKIDLHYSPLACLEQNSLCGYCQVSSKLTTMAFFDLQNCSRGFPRKRSSALHIRKSYSCCTSYVI